MPVGPTRLIEPSPRSTTYRLSSPALWTAYAIGPACAGAAPPTRTAVPSSATSPARARPRRTNRVERIPLLPAEGDGLRARVRGCTPGPEHRGGALDEDLHQRRHGRLDEW